MARCFTVPATHAASRFGEVDGTKVPGAAASIGIFAVELHRRYVFMSPYLACLVVVVSVGASVVWSSRRNLVSQAFALLAIYTAIWICLYWRLRTPWGDGPVPWLRAIAAVADFFPWVIWWVGRCAILPHGSWRDFFSIGRYWMSASLMLASIALTPWFIPAESTASQHLVGIAYIPHQVGQFCLFLALPIYAVTAISSTQGFARSMAKLVFIGGGLAALVALSVKSIAPRFSHLELAAAVPMVASAFFVATAWAVSSQQLLDARSHMLIVLRRSVGLVGAAFVITALVERTWDMPHELQVLISTTTGVSLALLFDVLTGTLLDRSLARKSLAAARSLQQFATDIAALPAVELHATAAPRLAETLSSDAVTIFWRSAGNQPLRLISSHHAPDGCPHSLRDDHALLSQSTRERAPWWLLRRLPAVDPGLTGFALCVPAIERNQVFLLVLLGHKHSPLGFTQSELSALQAWALACHHTLTTRALLERENAQQQLVYAGKLAAGIAHNLRNPLATVRAFLEADAEIPRPQLDELHDFALKESSRIQSTIDGLTALSRGERFALQPHDLHALVARAVETNQPYFAECGATVAIEGAPDSRLVLAEPWQLTTALTNLLRNSAEEVARDGGGWIRVELGAGPPGCVEVRVRDSGRGLPAHIRNAVFSRDLFAQTTKATTAPGRRTGFGIGLHSTMLIVTIGHGGHFDYRDGAFVITLPVAPASTPSGK